MILRSKFLAIEGVDGAGKRTQIDLLCRLLEQRRVPHVRFSFPRYESFFGRMVARFLNGEFGSLSEVHPAFSALLYAGDRLEARPALEKALEEDKVVIADRYIASNLAHQGARVPAAKRDDFLRWLEELEYKIYGLPAEGLVVYLRVPAAEAQKLVERKSRRDYTEKSKDLLEADLRHLEEAARVYDHLAAQPHWLTIECYSTATQSLRRPEEIHQEMIRQIEERAGYLVRRERHRKFAPTNPSRI
jgi:dTMP kinase